MERLAVVLGHTSTEVTRRYAHLRSDHLGEADRRLLAVDLQPSEAPVIPLSAGDREVAATAKGGAIGHLLGTRGADDGSRGDGFASKMERLRR